MAGKTHRLTDIHTDEVSLVDRAANEKRFLIVKKDDTNMALGAPVQKNPDGSYSAGASAAPAGDAAPPAAPAAPPKVSKAGAALTQDAKDALDGVIAASIASLEDAKALVSGAQIVGSEAEMDTTAIVDAIMSASENSEDAIMAIAGSEGEDDGGGDVGTPPATPSPDLPLGKRIEASVLKRRLASITKGQIPIVIEKAGAKMAKTRLNTLKSIIRSLHKFAREIEPPRLASPAAKAAPADPAPPAAMPAEFQALIDKAAHTEAAAARLAVEKKALEATPPAASTAGKPGEVAPVEKAAHRWGESLTRTNPWKT